VSPSEIGLAALAAMLVLVLVGMRVAIALMLCSFVGVWAIRGSAELAGLLLALAANDTIASYHFGVVPLFVLMGFVVAESGAGRDAYDVAAAAFRRFRGGLGVGTVWANAIFAAITGISIASAAVFTRIAVPEMRRYGYNPRFAVGVVAGSSVLGMLIPPSLLLILYGIISETNIGDLFLAGIGPGLLLATVFGLGVMLAAAFAPNLVQPEPQANEARMPAREFLAKLLPIATLILFVLGGIYGGLFTPVEAGAMGALGAIAIGLARGTLGWRAFARVLVETGLVSATVCFLIIAAQMYSRMLAFSGLPAGLAEFAAGADLGLYGLLALYVAICVVMGMILDSSSIMLILVPLMLPVIAPMEVNLIWFGIVTVIAIEIGLLTPPFGISVYVIRSTLGPDSDIGLGDIFAGAAPFALMMLLVLVLVIAFPALSIGLL